MTDSQRHSARIAEPQLPVTVCIPVRNEESNLDACLSSLGAAFSDVFIVDSGSTDRTRAIAKAQGCHVVDFVWNGRFPKKRNWALRTLPLAHPWVLFLDADERLTTEFIDELRRTIVNTKHVGFWLRYTNHFMGVALRHGDQMRKLALFRRDAGEYETLPEESWSHLDMEVHEHPILSGSAGTIKAPISHEDYRGLHHYIAKHNEYSTWEASRYRWLQKAKPDAWEAFTSRQRFKYQHLDKWWLAHLYFWSCLLLHRGILDGLTGWRFASLKRRYFADIRLKIFEARRLETAKASGQEFS